MHKYCVPFDKFWQISMSMKPTLSSYRTSFLVQNILSSSFFLHMCVYIYTCIFIYFYLWLPGSSLVHAWTFSSCSEQSLLFSCSVWAPHRSGFSCCKAQTLGAQISVGTHVGLQSAGSLVVAHSLSYPMACGIFLDQGSNQCPLHRKVDA